MAKAALTLGFAEFVETAPDAWTPSIKEKSYVADVIRDYKQWKPGESINDTIDIQSRFQIVLDDYLQVNQAQLKYVTYGGVKWRVRSINLIRPRIEISVGGVYNEKSS